MKKEVLEFTEVTGEESIMTLYANDQYDEILRFEQNGEIYIKGDLVTNDLDVVDGFRDFLNSQGYPAGESYLKQILDLASSKHNDMELGKEVRKLMIKLSKRLNNDIQ
jgi:hypothetical protein